MHDIIYTAPVLERVKLLAPCTHCTRTRETGPAYAYGTNGISAHAYVRTSTITTRATRLRGDLAARPLAAESRKIGTRPTG